MFRKSYLFLFVLILLLGLGIAACDTADEETPAVDEEEAADEEVEEGEEAAVRDTLVASMDTQLGSMDPSFVNTAGDYYAIRLWNDSLVFIDEEGQPDLERSVASSWEVNEDGTVWTFELPEGILFHDGKEMTSRDVKFTYDRLRDPEIGATTVEMYSNIVDISTPDDYTIVFELENVNPTFLIDLNPHQSMILDADNPDYDTVYNGIGPFVVDEYVPEDRITFNRNENYWRSDSEGTQLPYLERVELVIMQDASTRMEAMRGGQTQLTTSVPGEFIDVLDAEEHLQVVTGPSNTHHTIRMRSDVEPFNDVRVRQALKMATNRSEIAEVAYEGVASVGLDTPIGPAYGDLFFGKPEPERDIEQAKELLAEAGYPDGLELTLVCVESSPIADIAILWQEQMKDIDVNVDIELTSSDNYYSQWLDLDLGITSWGSRVNPYHYFALAYVTGAQWNETHFSDPELDELVSALSVELDDDERVRLYHEIQQIMFERGPVIIAGFVQNVFAMDNDLQGLNPHIEKESLDFTEFYFSN